MKDYRLSEIKAHCKARVAKHQNPCKGCEMEVVCKDTFPVGWDIEPRDMIELPCKEKNTWGNLVSYDVIFRDKYGHTHIIHDFFDEAKADAFLADLKGENNGN